MSPHPSEALSHPELDTTLVLRLGYRGAAFHGYAEQEGLRTVAGELREALETFLRRPVDMACAGRTDAGVHAQAQYVSVPMYQTERARLDARRIVRALQALTPNDITLLGVYGAKAGFSARFDAQARRYVYRLVDGVPPTLLWDMAWWHRGRLDVAAMDEAAQALVGEKDFISFCKRTSAVDKPTVRNVQSVRVERRCELGEPVVQMCIKASAFLHTMVRSIMGSLALVGEGKREVGWISQVIAAKKRQAAGPTAPACGLTLAGVDYRAGSLEPWDIRPWAPDAQGQGFL